MPAIWSSSERPLSVRTIWVDGIRHAVLSPDDPLINTKIRRRLHTSKDKDDRISSKMIRRQSAPTCDRLLSNDSGRLLKSFPITKDIKGELFENQCVENFTIEIKSIDELWNSSNDSSRSNVDKFELPEIRSNLLSERVLQWLDLSGKVQNYVKDVEEVNERLNIMENRDSRKFTSSKNEISMMKRKMAIKNYKLERERKPECFERSERRMTRRKLFEIDERAKRKDLIEIEEKKSTIEEEEKKEKEEEEDPSKMAKVKEKEEEKKRSFTNSLSPVGRPQLHIFMPKLNCNEKRNASSQESLICD
ncbi:DNA ligase 1-like isoform X1 [Vespa mandarinia]|uniref:DNA ligase 1-like isoform X1 n=1 Tax=Vespa mandarinia TaxID=7446 RepID=UPI0016192817|nr:DNA ligase 1-like isoform X1 [Vespa mandarinia]